MGYPNTGLEDHLKIGVADHGPNCDWHFCANSTPLHRGCQAYTVLPSGIQHFTVSSSSQIMQASYTEATFNQRVKVNFSIGYGVLFNLGHSRDDLRSPSCSVNVTLPLDTIIFSAISYHSFTCPSVVIFHSCIVS